MEIRDWLTIAALILGPVFAAILVLWNDARIRRRVEIDKRKIDVLYDLVRSRAAFNTYRNREVLESALNAIPIILRDDAKVCEKYKTAWQAVGTKAFEGLLTDLVRAVCAHVGYENVDSEVIKGVFLFPG